MPMWGENGQARRDGPAAANSVKNRFITCFTLLVNM